MKEKYIQLQEQHLKNRDGEKDELKKQVLELKKLNEENDEE